MQYCNLSLLHAPAGSYQDDKPEELVHYPEWHEGKHSYHEDTPVAVSVDAPQLKIGLGLDGGSSGSPINQSQLSKTASFSNTGHPLAIHIHLQTEQETS